MFARICLPVLYETFSASSVFPEYVAGISSGKILATIADPKTVTGS